MNTLRFLKLEQDTWTKQIISQRLKDSPITPTYITEYELRESTHLPWIIEINVYLDDGTANLDEQLGCSDFVIDEIVNGNGTLIVNCAGEGDSILSYKTLYRMYNNGCQIVNNCIYASGCISTDHDYSTWRNKYNIPDEFNISHIAHCTFEMYYLVDHKRYSEYDPTTYINRDKMFLHFNRIFRFHRIMSVVELYNRGLLDAGYVSLFDDVGTTKLSEMTAFPYGVADTDGDPEIDMWNTSLPIAQKLVPLIIDEPSGINNLAHADAPELHRTSYFSLVSATQFFSHINPDREQTVQFNEKPIKPIINKQPFVMLGCKHYIRFMKEYGYKSFSPWIDESYDEIESDLDRLLAVIDEVERLCAISKADWDIMIEEMVPVLEYNYRLLAGAKERHYHHKWGFKNLLPYTIEST